MRVFHPFIFAIYPTLAVMAGSLGILNPKQAVRPFILILLIIGIIFFLLFLKLKDVDRAGFILSLLIFMIFYYGYSYKLPKEIVVFGIPISRHLIILLFWAFFLPVVTSNWVWMRVRPHVITRVLNLSSALSLLIPLRLILIFMTVGITDPLYAWTPPSPPNIEIVNINTEYKPDIYYIIVDGYARDDVLSELYGFENSDFIGFLEQSGFYVANYSTSNYIKTALSLSSSLNFEYLDYFFSAAEKSKDLSPLTDLTIHSKARYLLEGLGYQIFISGEYLFSQISDPAIVYYSSNKKSLSLFESLLLETSMTEIFIDLGDLELSDYTYQRHRERILDGFSQIQRLAAVKGPKFIFVHILAPHPPFVFDIDGNPVEPNQAYTIFDATEYTGGLDAYINGYIAQLKFINGKLKETISYILNNSVTDPVIIVQGDHGSAAYFDWSDPTKGCTQERFSILNAYYLPQKGGELLYETITPVNTFRVIFDANFNSQLGLLADKNYVSVGPNWYKFSDATEMVHLPCEIEDR